MYVLVDEYQDTNHAQYLLTKMLSGRWNNICVVGDFSQVFTVSAAPTFESR